MACLLFLAAAVAEAQDFDARHLAVHGRRQDTLLYDITGDGLLDIVNTSVDFDVDPPVRWMALHVQQRGKGFPEKPDFIWSVHRSAAALTFGNFVPEGGIEICTIAPDGVYYYGFDKGAMVEEPRKLIHTRTFFSAPSDRALPVWMFAGDLSADGRDDLVLPVPDGYAIYFQTAPGQFGKVSRLTEAERTGSAPSLAPERTAEQLDFVSALFNLQVRLPRLAAADIDGDGRQDLATVRGHVITYFFQKEPCEYRSQRGWSSRHILSALEETRAKDAISMTQIAFHDIDGDRRPDLVVTRIQGQVGLFESLQTRIDVHFGVTGRGNYEPNLYISIHGVSVDPHFADMNGDGALDCLSSRLRTDIVNQALTMGILGDISIDYEIFQFDPKGKRYSESPVYSYPIRVTFEALEKKGAASRPLLFVTDDLTGDGRRDQVRVNPKTDTLEVHPGRDRFVGSEKHIDFDPTSHRNYKLERYPRYIQFHDLDGDGRTDILLYYSGQLGVLRTGAK